MKERIVIIFIAVTLGLLATTVAFFLYESAKPQKIAVDTATPTPQAANTNKTADTFLLVVTEPKDESITDKRSLSVKGKTNPENTVIISSNTEDVTVNPAADGEFSATVTIAAGVNKLVTTAVNPQGETKTDTKIVSFTAEEF